HENSLWRESQRPRGQAMERRDEQSGDELHQDAEGHLGGEKGVHQASARMRVFRALERTDRLDAGSAQRRRQTEEQRDEEREPDAEGELTPASVERNADRILGYAQHGYDERRRPPGEQRAQSGAEH